MKELIEKIEKSKYFWSGLGISFVFFLLRFPSLFEPNWYGDEGIYQVVGKAILNGRLLYTEVWDNKPPLLYLLYSLVNSELFYIKFFSLGFGIISVILFLLLSRKFFKNDKASFISTLIFSFILGTPIVEGNIANAENFMIAPILASFLILLSKPLDILKKGEINKKKNYLLYFLSGSLLGTALLIKFIALFDFIAILIFLIIINFPNKIFSSGQGLQILLKIPNQAMKNIGTIFIGLILPISSASVFFLSKSAFAEFSSAVFFQMFDYVDYGNKFIIPQGILLIKLLLLVIFIFIIFRLRRKFSAPTLFIFIWVGISLFNSFFAQRPYNHYLTVLLPGLSLLLGNLLENKKNLNLNISLLIITLGLVIYGFNFSVKSLYYYKNFADMILGNKSVSAYREFFDRNTPIDYMIAEYLSPRMNPQEGIFIWGNNAQLYHLLNVLPPGKFTVAYHISGNPNRINQTQKSLSQKMPKFIVIMPYLKTFPFEIQEYSERITINGAIIYERIF